MLSTLSTLALALLASPQDDGVEPAPLYITVMTHFDAPWDMGALDMAAFNTLQTDHPDSRWTHLMNPAAYTQSTPLLASIESLILTSRDQYGGEIGVHTHMYPSLIAASGVTFSSSPSASGSPPGCCCDSGGYSVPISSYAKDDIKKILRFTVDTFLANGLCRPRTYCAGFYTTDVELQESLVELDFNVSAAAFPVGVPFGATYGPCWDILSGWDNTVTEMTLPYPVSTSTILPGGPAPYLTGDQGTLYEIPQTCKIDWMVTAADMKSIIQAHLARALAGTPSAVCIAMHDTLADSNEVKFDEVLDFIDLIRATSPVPTHYVTAAELRQAFLGIDGTGSNGAFLSGAETEVSVGTGGFQMLEIDTCPPTPGLIYGVAGSASGTTPGLSLGALVVPLNPDVYFGITLATLGTSGPVFASSGTLSAIGDATATFQLPAGSDPALAGLGVHHAAAIYDATLGQVTAVTNAVPVALVP